MRWMSAWGSRLCWDHWFVEYWCVLIHQFTYTRTHTYTYIHIHICICMYGRAALQSNTGQFFFFWIRGKPHPQESALCGLRWASKTPAVPSSYKRCTPWLELETCCANFKPFAITLRPFGTKKGGVIIHEKHTWAQLKEA
jgi:hypothetical protein